MDAQRNGHVFNHPTFVWEVSANLAIKHGKNGKGSQQVPSNRAMLSHSDLGYREVPPFTSEQRAWQRGEPRN